MAKEQHEFKEIRLTIFETWLMGKDQPVKVYFCDKCKTLKYLKDNGDTLYKPALEVYVYGKDPDCINIKTSE